MRQEVHFVFITKGKSAQWLLQHMSRRESLDNPWKIENFIILLILLLRVSTQKEVS